MVSVREEMWAQAARDRNTLEAELGARNEREKKKMLEEARDRAESMVQEVGDEVLVLCICLAWVATRGRIS